MSGRFVKTGAAVAGVIPVAWLVLGSRWASHVGRPPLFLTDVLLAVAFMHHLLTLALGPRTKSGRATRPLLWMLLVWVMARLATSPWPFTIETIRDVAPYIYVSVGLLAASSFSRATEMSRARTARWLVWALGLHAVWYGVSVTWSWVSTLVRIDGAVTLFSVRPDVDTALVGVFAGWLLSRALVASGTGARWALLGVWVTWFLIFQSPSRAGWLGAAAAMAFVAWAAHRDETVNRTKVGLMVAAAPVLVAVVALLVPSTGIGQRLIGTFTPDPVTQAAGMAAGTTSARRNAWPILLDYVNADPIRQIAGVGFGPDIMRESRAHIALLGAGSEYTTRSPHNYWLGSYARLGVVGLGLLIFLAAAVARRLLRLSRLVTRDPLLRVVALVPVALAVPLSVGVVLESPFGAIPFWWCVGVLLAWRSSDGHDEVVTPGSNEHAPVENEHRAGMVPVSSKPARASSRYGTLAPHPNPPSSVDPGLARSRRVTR